MITTWPQIRCSCRCAGSLQSSWTRCTETCWWPTTPSRATSGNTHTHTHRHTHTHTHTHTQTHTLHQLTSLKVYLSVCVQMWSDGDLVVWTIWRWLIRTCPPVPQVSGCDHLGAAGVGEPALQTLLGQTGAHLRCEGTAAATSQTAAPGAAGWALVRRRHTNTSLILYHYNKELYSYWRESLGFIVQRKQCNLIRGAASEIHYIISRYFTK